MKTPNGLVIHYVSGFALPLLLTFFVSVASSVITILLPLSIGKYYALVFNTGSNKMFLFQFLPQEFLTSAPLFLQFFSGLLLLKLCLGYVQRYMVSSVGERVVHQIRIDLFRYQLGINMEVYDEQGIGKYLLRYSGDLKSIQNYISKGIIGFTVDLGLLGIAIFSLLYINQNIAWIVLLSMPLIAIPIVLLNHKLNRISERRRNKRSNLLSFVNERLISILTVKGLNRHVPELEKFKKRSSILLLEGLKFHQIASLIYVLIPVLLYSMLAVLMYVVYQWKVSGQVLDQGSTLAAFLLIISMLPVLRRLLRVTVIWKLGKISLHKLILVFRLPSNDDHDKEILEWNDKKITIKDLQFRFQDKAVIPQLSAVWKGNGIHLIHGNVGTGKSTLIKLFLGIYSPSQGQIMIGNQSMDTLSVKSLRQCITVVSADYPLIGKTVFEAISYSRKSSKRRAAHEMLLKLQSFLPAEEHMQLDDKILNGGSNLSKGQEMLLLLARALLTNKPILLLDEPLKNMDRRMRFHSLKLIDELRTQKMILLFTKRSKMNRLHVASEIEL